MLPRMKRNISLATSDKNLQTINVEAEEELFAARSRRDANPIIWTKVKPKERQIKSKKTNFFSSEATLLQFILRNWKN